MKNDLRGELAVCTLNCVKSIEKHDRNLITRIYFNQERVRAFGGLCKYLAGLHRFYKVVSDPELEKLCNSHHHGGVVAFIKLPVAEELSALPVSQLAESGQHAVICCDLGNPNNFGAIVRSAAFFGFTQIFVAGDCNLLTTSSYRTAEGAMSWVNIRKLTNLSVALQKGAGKIPIVGTAVRVPAPLESRKINLDRLKELSASPLVILFGNEETGLPLAILRQCSHIASIPPKNDSIDSLNVAQSAAIFLSTLSSPNRPSP